MSKQETPTDDSTCDRCGKLLHGLAYVGEDGELLCLDCCENENTKGNDMTFDEWSTQQEVNLKPKLTPEFLQTLVHAVLACNHSVDMIETVEFANWCFLTAGLPIPPSETWVIPEIR